MIRSIARAGMLGAAALATVSVAQVASATAFTFDFTKVNYEGPSYGFSSCSNASVNCATGTKLNVKATGWNASDSNKSAITNGTIDTAKLGVYQGGGLGVIYGADKGSDGTHQVDSYGNGTDFIMLQFDQDVTLSSIGRNYYSLPSGSNRGEASYWADTGNILGAPSSTANINLDGGTFNENIFSNIDSNGNLNTKSSASVWLVSARFNSNDDGFKIKSLIANTVNVPAAVPEPASWAMMIVGFGAVGYGMRRRKTSGLATA